MVSVEQPRGPLPCVPETRVETRLTITERQRVGGRKGGLHGGRVGREGRREDGNRKPRGLNLHPAKQPRTTLFDWLPAGLPSVPTWTNLHESLRAPLSLSSFPSPCPHLIFPLSFFFYFLSLPLVILFRRNYPLPLFLPPLRPSRPPRFATGFPSEPYTAMEETHFVPRTV